MPIKVPASEILKKRKTAAAVPVAPPIQSETPQTAMTREQLEIAGNPIQTAAIDVGKGALRSLGKGVLNFAKLGKDALDATAGVISGGKNKVIKEREEGIYKGASSAIEGSKALKSKLLPQSVADVAGDIVTTILPFAKVGKVAEAATALMKSRKLATILKVGLDAAGSAGLTAAISDDGKRVSNAKMVGGTVGALGLAGAALAPLAKKVPKKLYEADYKVTADEASDMFQGIRTSVKSGKKVDTNTVAEYAMNKWKLAGSIEKQEGQLAQIIETAQKSLVEKAKAIRGDMKIPKRAFKFAEDFAEEHADIGRGEVASVAKDFARQAKNGFVRPETALKFKQLLDRISPNASFKRPSIVSNSVYWREFLRGKVNSYATLAGVNRELAAGYKAKELLIKAATKAASRQPITWTEILSLTGASSLFNLPGFLGAGALIGGRKALQSPAFRTKTAQMMKSFGKAYKGTAKGALRSGVSALVRAANEEDQSE